MGGYMRIQFGNRIYSCDFVTRVGGIKSESSLINAKTTNGLYTIKFTTPYEADLAFVQLLTKGYYNASDTEYTN